VQPKNIIFITTDQQKSDAMGFEDKSYYTPNLDRLIQKGIQFTSHICTAAQCTPARASWMTGRYPHEVGVNQIGHMLDPKDENIAKVFNEHGYETVYLGKWHLGGQPADYGFAITDYRTENTDFWGANELPKYLSHRDAVTTAQALNYLEDYDGKGQFFMQVSWYMPHPNSPDTRAKGPFEDISSFNESYNLTDMPIPPSFFQDDLSTKPLHQQKRSETKESRLSEDMVKEDAKRYRKLISLMDRNLGKILNMLEQRNMLESTMIVFTSDHGDMQGAHRLRLKGVVPYKELYNVPLVMYIPWQNSKRKRIEDLNSSASLPSTLLEAVNISAPNSFYPSLLPLLKQTETDHKSYVFIEHYKAYWGEYPFRGIQNERFKYVYYYREDVEEMYDLKLDPDELVNICNDPHYESVKADLREMVEEWWIRTGALSKEPIMDVASNWGRE
jgi:arylsulfatase